MYVSTHAYKSRVFLQSGPAAFCIGFTISALMVDYVISFICKCASRILLRAPAVQPILYSHSFPTSAIPSVVVFPFPIPSILLSPNFHSFPSTPPYPSPLLPSASLFSSFSLPPSYPISSLCSRVRWVSLLEFWQG